jgi:asparaginyl-tRNA synthetase
LTDYPKDIKAFYMRLNDDGKTVRAMDVLIPKAKEYYSLTFTEKYIYYIDWRDYWWKPERRKIGSFGKEVKY